MFWNAIAVRGRGHSGARFARASLAFVAGLLFALVGFAQPKLPADPVKASALKLPDGTIIFVARGADDPDPSLERVLLSPQEYKALLDRLDEAKKAKDATKPTAPSGCAIRGKVELRGDRPIAALTVTMTFRTTLPKTVVALGCQRAALLSAKSNSGKLPILNNPGEDGLTLLADAVGEQSVTLELEVPVIARGNPGEIGFDLGLPRAAITTLQFEPPATKGKLLLVGTRLAEVAPMPPRPAEVKRFSVAVEQLATKPLPLGATDVLELSWEAPTAALQDQQATVETDLVVRVEETQLESTARIRLRGPRAEWPLVLPVGADVTVERGAGSDPGIAATNVGIVRPTDPNKPQWLIRPPADMTNAEWLVTVVARQARPKPNDPKFRGPYGIGPFTVTGGVRQTGRIRFRSTPGVRIGFKPIAEIRRQDLPPNAEEDLIALFQFASLPAVVGTAKPPAWFDLDLRPAVATPRVRPLHKLKLTATGWRLESTIQVIPPPRTELEQLTVDVPNSWQSVEAGPDDLVDELSELKQTSTQRTLAVQLKSGVRAPVEVTLTAIFPLGTDVREVSLALPRFPQADERDIKIQVNVPEGLDLRGSATTADNPNGEPLKSPIPTGTAPLTMTSLTGEFERGVNRLDLAWQPHRPELIGEGRAEVTVQDRQIAIVQVWKFRSPREDAKPIRLRGPSLIGLQSTPPLDPVGPGEWEFRPPATAREFTLQMAYAIRPTRKPEMGADSTTVPIALVWPTTATRVETVMRVWGTGGVRRADRFEGPWRELPVEPAAERESLPWMTLTGTGTDLPLSLTVPTRGTSPVLVERSLAQATFTDEGTTVFRVRYLLRRWPTSGVEIELPGNLTPEVLVDGKRIEPTAVAGSSETRQIRVPIPEPKPTRPFAVLELRTTQSSANPSRGSRTIALPILANASFRTPLRWYLATSSQLTPFVWNADYTPDLNWTWQGLTLAPRAGMSLAELDASFALASEGELVDSSNWPSPDGTTLLARQSRPGNLEILWLPRWPWLIGVSGMSFLFGLSLSRIRSRWLGPILVAMALSLTLASVRFPQPITQLAVAVQPGLMGLGVFLLGQRGWKRFRQWRAAQFSTFSRSWSPSAASAPLPAPSAPPANPQSASNRGPSAYVSLEPGGSTVPPAPSAR